MSDLYERKSKYGISRSCEGRVRGFLSTGADKTFDLARSGNGNGFSLWIGCASGGKASLWFSHEHELNNFLEALQTAVECLERERHLHD